MFREKNLFDSNKAEEKDCFQRKWERLKSEEKTGLEKDERISTQALLEKAKDYVFEEGKLIGRRDFLKYGLGALAGLFFFKKLGSLEKALTELETDKEKKDPNSKRKFLPEIDFIFRNPKEIAAWEIASEIDDFPTKENEPLKFRLDLPVKVDLEDLSKAKNYWKGEFLNGRLKKDFKEGLERLKPYERDLKRIFRRSGVPENLIYLSLAESFFDPRRVSPAGARGVFQLMPETAKKYHLVVNNKIDERTDIIKSAQAAATILKDNYEVSRDWDMTFSGYNWGKFWTFPKLGQENSFEKYVEHFSRQGEMIRRQIKNAPYLNRKVGKQDTLFRIARTYGLSVDEIKAFNRKKNNIIRPGEIIKIPLKNRQHREKVFKLEMAGYRENFNYVPKVRAVLEAVNKYT